MWYNFFLPVFLLTFILLKVFDVIDWSWPVVLIPLWVACGLVVAGLVTAITVFLVAHFVDKD